MKIKTGDTVLVRTGKDAGKRGTVARALPKEQKVVVEGVNMIKRHMRTRVQGGKGEIVERAMPIHVSNVALVDEKTKKAGRVSYNVTNGVKTRVVKTK